MLFTLLFTIQSILLISIPLNIYPELFYFPWLVAKGQIPYIHFFDHHGFLLYYLLAPFTYDTSLAPLKAVFFAAQSLYLLLTYHALKKYVSGISLFLGCSIFMLLNFYFTGGNMWYESFIGLIYITIYVVLQSHYRQHTIIFGLLVVWATMIKPTAALIYAPVWFITRNIRVVIVVISLWLLVGAYYLLNDGLVALIDNLFLFNSFYSKYMAEEKVFFMDWPFIRMLVVYGLIAGIFSLFANKRRDISTIGIFLLVGISHCFPRFEYTNLVPATPFIALWMIYPLSSARSAARKIYLVVVITMIIFLGQRIYGIYPWMQNRVPYIEQTHICDTYVHKDSVPTDKFYTFSNNPEFYFLTDKPPHLYHPLVFPWYITYYPHLEKRIIADIEKAQVMQIFIPQPLDERYTELNTVHDYIQENFDVFKSSVPCPR